MPSTSVLSKIQVKTVFFETLHFVESLENNPHEVNSVYFCHAKYCVLNKIQLKVAVLKHFIVLRILKTTEFAEFCIFSPYFQYFDV